MPDDDVRYSCGCDDVDGEDIENGDGVDDGDDGGDDGGDETEYAPDDSDDLVLDGVAEIVDGGVVGDCSEYTTSVTVVGTILAIV